MDQQERKQFWDVLFSLQGIDIQSEAEKLTNAITIPARWGTIKFS